MNPELPNQLAAQLKANPLFFQDMDDALLSELVLRYEEGDLATDDAAEVESLLRTNAKAKAIRQRLQEADRFIASNEGRTWLDNLADQALPPKPKYRRDVSPSTLFEGLSEAITALFTFRATLATASGDEGLKRKLADGQTQIAVNSDSAGRLWLRVTSTAPEFRDGSFMFDVEPAPSVLKFSEIEPGLFSARVCVNADVAEALGKNAVLKLTPLPPTKD